MANSSENKSGTNTPRLFSEMETEEEMRTAFSYYEQLYREDWKVWDYSKMAAFQNVALYTPALSDGYINNVARLGRLQQEAIEKDDLTQDAFHVLLEDTPYSLKADDLKFINPNSRLCFYPWVLFSGGQGAKTKKLAQKDNWVTQTPRDERVVVLGDSGGFQIQQQTIPFDPKETPERMLRWLERIADQSMVLDFPTGGISTGAMVPHVERLIQEGIDVEAQAIKTGFSTGFMGCLIRTIQNNDYFEKHHIADATNLLNVIQGRNEEESHHWYEAIKHYRFNRWAFAGKHSVQLSMTLRRLIQMRDEGLLMPNQWIHFLGVSTLKVGVALTYIQRNLRKYTDAADVQITFDSKSPTDGVSNGYRAVAGYDFAPNKWSFHTAQTNLKKYKTSERLLKHLATDWVERGENRVLSHSTLAHVLQLKHLAGTKDGEGKRIPTAVQQTLLSHHNTQGMIEGFRHAYKYLDDKHASKRPQSIQFLDYYLEMIFKHENPMSIIDDYEAKLDALALEGFFGR